MVASAPAGSRAPDQPFLNSRRVGRAGTAVQPRRPRLRQDPATARIAVAPALALAVLAAPTDCSPATRGRARSVRPSRGLIRSRLARRRARVSPPPGGSPRSHSRAVGRRRSAWPHVGVAEQKEVVTDQFHLEQRLVNASSARPRGTSPARPAGRRRPSRCGDSGVAVSACPRLGHLGAIAPRLRAVDPPESAACAEPDRGGSASGARSASARHRVAPRHGGHSRRSLARRSRDSSFASAMSSAAKRSSAAASARIAGPRSMIVSSTRSLRPDCRGLRSLDTSTSTRISLAVQLLDLGELDGRVLAEPFQHVQCADP